MDSKKIVQDKNTGYAFSKGVVFESTETEAVLLNLESEDIFGLNETGTQIARLISKENSFEEICQFLEKLYSISPEEIAIETAQLIAELLDRQLIRVVR